VHSEPVLLPEKTRQQDRLTVLGRSGRFREGPRASYPAGPFWISAKSYPRSRFRRRWKSC